MKRRTRRGFFQLLASIPLLGAIVKAKPAWVGAGPGEAIPLRTPMVSANLATAEQSLYNACAKATCLPCWLGRDGLHMSKKWKRTSTRLEIVASTGKYPSLPSFTVNGVFYWRDPDDMLYSWDGQSGITRVIRSE